MAVINTCITLQVTNMPQIVEAVPTPSNDKLQNEPRDRESVEAQLAKISRRVTAALEAEGLRIQVFLLGGGRGSVLTFETMDNSVSDEDWWRASDIVISVTQQVTQIERLSMHSLTCAEVQP